MWAGPAIVLFVLTIHFYFTYRHLDHDEFMSKQNQLLNHESAPRDSVAGEDSGHDVVNSDEGISDEKVTN